MKKVGRRINLDNELLNNLEKLHTTELGIIKIKRTLSLDTDDVHSDRVIAVYDGRDSVFLCFVKSHCMKLR